MSLGLNLSGMAPLLLYIGGFIVFLLSASGRPHLGLYYLVPLLPLQTLRYKLHQFPLGSQWIDIILLGVLIGVWRKNYSIINKSPVTRLLLALGVVTYLSLWKGAFFLNFPLPLWFDDPRVSDWKNYMVIFALFFLTLASIRGVKQMKILLLLMCLAVLMINRDYLNTMRSRDFSSFSYDVRDSGVMGYAGVNGLAALEAQVAVFLLGFTCFYQNRRAKWGYLVVVATSLGALMYTLSRGGYAALLVGAIFVGIVKNRKLLLIVAAFLLVWQSLVPTAVQERVFMTHGEDGALDPSAGDRVTLWENAMEIIKTDPIFGTGFDTYKFLHAVGPYEDTHNYYVKVTLETGVIGLFIFLGIVGKMFLAGFRLRHEEDSDGFLPGLGMGLAAMVVACAVTNCFGDRWTYIEETGFIWVILAMVVRGHILLNEAAEEPESPVEMLAA
jgi:O-antigen ligase